MSYTTRERRFTTSDDAQGPRETLSCFPEMSVRGGLRRARRLLRPDGQVQLVPQGANADPKQLRRVGAVAAGRFEGVPDEDTLRLTDVQRRQDDGPRG